MGRILIVSDSHGNISNLRRVIDRTKDVDMLIHLGDVQDDERIMGSLCDYPVKMVKGNCDFYSKNEIFSIIPFENHKIFATHGHRYDVDWGIDKLSYAAMEAKCDIAMYGHTHIPEIIYGDDITIVNPGSITRPRQYNHKPSYILADFLEDGKVFFNLNYL